MKESLREFIEVCEWEFGEETTRKAAAIIKLDARLAAAVCDILDFIEGDSERWHEFFHAVGLADEEE